MVSNLEPQEIDFDLEWAELRTSLDQAFENKITRNQYTQGYGRVYKICIAVDPKSSELYSKISQFLEEKADFISKGLQNADGPELLEKYCSEWKSYKKAAEDINSICRYLNINHIDSKRHDSMEVQLSQDLDDVLQIKDLSYEKWKMKVLSQVDDALVTACLLFIEQMRSNVELSKEEKNHVKFAIQSFTEVCHYRRRNPLKLYQEKFEVRFLEETSTFYGHQARKFLETGDVGNYMTQVLKVLKDEECRAFEFLDKTTISKQTEKLAKSLIHDNLEFLFEEAKTMVHNENADHLHKLYQLLKDMENPLARLVKMFKSYVESVGKEKIKEAKTPKDFVDIICLHYDNFKRFVDNVFNEETVMDHQFITGNPRSPDKNFIESLKDAMRTVVNHKDSSKERSRAPELLAQYSDQLLRKKTDDGHIDDKLDEVIKCLEFVSEKDLFQGNYTRRLAKRLIFGQSSNTEAERVMIEKLKTVCVYEFSSKIKRMYEDIKNSACQQEEFNKKYQDQTFHLDVKVLQDGCWPFSKVQQNFNLPNTLEASLQNYTSFYEEKHTNRRLKWIYNHSHADLRTCATQKMYVLKVTTFQLGILNSFNEADQLTLSEIRRETALDNKELLKQIKPCVENDILKIVTGQSINELTDETLFAANDAFMKRGTTVKLVPSSQKDKGDNLSAGDIKSVNQSVEEDRKFWVQACIARIMKSLKEATYSTLIQRIHSEAANRFQPSTSLIKKSIEVLLEKSFIERKPETPDTYLYVA